MPSNRGSAENFNKSAESKTIDSQPFFTVDVCIALFQNNVRVEDAQQSPSNKPHPLGQTDQ